MGDPQENDAQDSIKQQWLSVFQSNEVTSKPEDATDIERVAIALTVQRFTVDAVSAPGYPLSEALDAFFSKLEPELPLGLKFAVKHAIQERAAPPPPQASQDIEEACLRALKRAKREGSERGSISLSKVGTKQWALIQKAAKVKVKVLNVPDPAAGAPSSPLPAPFVWSNEIAENKQSDRYIPHLEQLCPLPDSLAWLKCGDNNKQLFDIQEPDMLHYDKIGGNTDMAIISSACMKVQAYNLGLHVLFELKKHPDAHDRCQAMCQLLLANIFSSDRKPVLVLTDLNDSWQLYWMDGTTIIGGPCSSREAAVMLINQLVAEAAALDAPGSNVPRAYVPDTIAARNPMPDFVGSSNPDVANLADLEGLLPKEELKKAHAAVMMQHLLQLPLFNGMVCHSCDGSAGRPPPPGMYK